MENRSPCRPLLKMRVFRPRPSSPDTPSSRTTSRTASPAFQKRKKKEVSKITATKAYKEACYEKAFTVGDFGVVDLAVGLNYPQRVGHGIRDDGGDEPDKGQAQQPQEQLAFRWLLDGFGQEVILAAKCKQQGVYYQVNPFSKRPQKEPANRTVANQG